MSNRAIESPATEEPRCPACGTPQSVATILAAAPRHWPAVRAATFRCGACGTEVATRLAPGRLALGYIYAAGAAHFSTEAEYAAPSITGVWEAPDGLHVRIAAGQGREQELVLRSATAEG